MNANDHELHGDASPDRARRLDWFGGRKFGIFVHWGLEAGYGKCKHVSSPQAQQIARDFDRNATGFDPQAWLDVFQWAGARYVVLTAKHGHDFFLYPSEVNPFHSDRDYVGELAQACGKRGMPLFLYFNLNSFGLPERAETGVKEKNVSEQQRRIALTLQEYCERYEPTGIWLDAWPSCVHAFETAGLDPREVFDFEAITAPVREHDENILIGNKEMFPPHTDFLTSESMFTTHFGEPLARPGVVTETADTLPGSGWFSTRAKQDDFFTARKIEAQSVYYLKRLISAVGRGSNYLLDAGPLPDGSLQRVEKEILLRMGEWLERNGRAVYDTLPLRDGRQDWGYAVGKDERIYLHIMDNRDLVKAHDCSEWDPCLKTSDWKTGDIPASGRLDIPESWAGDLTQVRGLHGGTLPVEWEGGICKVDAADLDPDPVSKIFVLDKRN